MKWFVIYCKTCLPDKVPLGWFSCYESGLAAYNVTPETHVGEGFAHELGVFEVNAGEEDWECSDTWIVENYPDRFV